MPWNSQTVREQLPNVTVRIGKEVYSARVTGRLNPIATVTVMADNRKYLRGAPWIDLPYSWESIAHALNNNRPLTV